MRPIKIAPVFKEAVWGGGWLKNKFGLDSGLPHQAEAWELTVREDGVNTTAEGIPLTEADPSAKTEDFPLLIKYIDAGDKLSIQVHPAKTEFWYIVDCEPGAWLIYGQNRDYTEAELRQALAEGNLEGCLHKQPVKPGECYFIPTGLTHAIGGGILIAEIQENSNITYRVYDYDRPGIDGKPRQLHTDQAFRVMKKFDEDELQALRFSVPYDLPAELRETSECIASCDKFTVVRHILNGKTALRADERFSHLMVIGGKGRIGDICVKGGDSVYVPAGTGEYIVEPECEMTILESFRL